MSDSWDDYAADWEGNEAVVAYAEKAYQSLIAQLDIEAYRVLDFGCGTGLLTEKLARRASAVVALDPSRKMIEVLNGKALRNVSTIAAELTPTLIDGSELLAAKFDLVLASSALAFVPDYPATLLLLRQLLKSGGHLVQWDWLKADDEAGPGFSEQAIPPAMARAGFGSCTVSRPFVIEAQGTAMPVLMAVARY